jgi:purine nucleosidase
VAIETISGLTLGMSIVDVTGVTGKPPNALWLDGVDPDGVTSLLHRMIAAHSQA